MDGSKEFRFPYEPYPIQVDFMKNLYQCLEGSKLGIFESPTGTGKSLSLICGALTWLEAHEAKKKSTLEEEMSKLGVNYTNNEDKKEYCILKPAEPEWFAAATKTLATTQRQRELKLELDRILLVEEKMKKLKERAKELRNSKNTLTSKENPKKTSKTTINFKKNENEDDIISDVSTDHSDNSDEEKAEETDNRTQIIFASRTHSQISQFVHEVKKSPFGDHIRVSALASRQQLCINEDVLRLNNNSFINEKCLEMQKKGSRSTSKSAEGHSLKKSKSTSQPSCPYLADSQKVQNVRDFSLSEVHDVESLAQLGKDWKACPYYAARNSISDAQLIAVPYQMLLQRPTRLSCGLKLKNNIIIIDEAHNLMDTISSIHNVCITGVQLSKAHWQLSQYQLKYSSRLSPKNLLHIKQLLFFLSCLLKVLGLSVKSAVIGGPEEEKVCQVIDFCVEAGFDHLNMNKLVEFCERSKLAQKLVGFKPAVPEVNPVSGLQSLLNKMKPDTVDPVISIHPYDEVSGSPLMMIVDFMRSLSHPSNDGRIIFSRKTMASKSFLKYLVLNPASLFEDFVKEPRSVIVAGGTMQPFFEFEFQLFRAAGAAQDRVVTFSCGHVIPPDHVLPLALTRGPSNKELNFSWSGRNHLLDELFNLILNVIQVVPGGVVCFLPSYDFEQQVFDHFQKKDYITKIENKKKLFREPRKASQVDQVLTEYAQSIRLSCGTKTGSLLLCVVGGKLSEGINFSDDLARCVIVVGLPFANNKSAELKEKMEYLDQTMMHLRPEGETRLPSSLYYNSLCWKSINQSIGRAIRHRNDYAIMILADGRYAQPTSSRNLPGWIAKRLVVAEKFGPTLASIRKFLHDRHASHSAAF